MGNIERSRALARSVAEKVGEYFGIDVGILYGLGRTNKLTKARGILLYILHRDMGLTIPFLAAEFRRTPRTIYWNCEQVDRFIGIYKDYKKDYAMLCEVLKKD